VKKIIYIGLSITLAFVILFFSFAPEDRVNWLIMAYRHFVDDPGVLCFDLHKDELKDIETARIVKVDQESNSISVTYRAKNDFGAYKIGVFQCELVNGEFSEAHARVVSSIQRINQDKKASCARYLVNINEYSDSLKKQIESFCNKEPLKLPN
jgi:hypothetical protein